jgi:hypothetical protein
MAVIVKLLRGRRLIPAAAFCMAVLGCMATAGLAQRLPQDTGAGTGGGAGRAPVVPPGIGGGMPAAPAMKPAAPELKIVPVVPAPAVPAPIIRFRCEVPAGQSTCKDPAPAEGAADETCDCARDLCYKDPSGARVCEKP